MQHLHSKARPDIFLETVDPDGRRAFFNKAIADDNWQIWIAGQQLKTLGFAMSELIDKDTGPIRHGHREGHIHQICVAPQARRCGLASGLMQSLLDDLRSQSPDRITVAYWAFNDTSKRFFEQMGFAPVMITAELSA